jgi:hypothetical protein
MDWLDVLIIVGIVGMVAAAIGLLAKLLVYLLGS